jgi:acetyl esterase/lipase
MRRREFGRLLAGGAVAAAMPGLCHSGPSAVGTYVYRTVGGCEIKADVHQAAPGASKPGVLWIHGGALIMGSRRGTGGLCSFAWLC